MPNSSVLNAELEAVVKADEGSAAVAMGWRLMSSRPFLLRISEQAITLLGL